MRNRTAYLVILVFIGIIPSLLAFTPRDENHEVRHQLRGVLLGPRSGALQSSTRIIEQRGFATRVRFDVRSQGDAFYLVFANESAGAFPVHSRGSYIVKRALADGRFLQFKVFYRHDPDFFLRVFPEGASSRVDVYAGDSRIHQGLLVPRAFDELLVEPFATLVRATRHRVDWELLLAETEPAAYGATRTMARRARGALDTLPDAEDGAMDAQGNLVFIESLVLQDQGPGFNCSGFAKWVADGIFSQLTGSLMDIERLKTKHLGTRGHSWSQPREDDRDPYFGLDWSRNIAVELEYAATGQEPAPEFADVTDVAYSTYREDVGYRVDELRKVLYFEALRNPNHFYIGSVNREFGSAPVLRQHVHVVVIFPHFTPDGRFRVDVMERNVETSVESLVRRYRDDYIHLVRIGADEAYVPPVIN